MGITDINPGLVMIFLMFAIGECYSLYTNVHSEPSDIHAFCVETPRFNITYKCITNCRSKSQ